MSKSKIIVAANIGLAVSKKKDEKSNLFSNNRHETFCEVHDTLATIYNKYSQNPNMFCVQELGYMTFKPAPFFGAAVASDFKTVVNLNGEARGVGIFSRNPDAIEVDTENDSDEICAIIDTYKDRNNRISKYAVINVYRLRHKDNNRSISTTIEAINKITRIIRNKYNVRKMIVLGDFNDEDPIFLQREFRELKNLENYHKHTATSRKTYIDRVFTNFNEVGFLEVLPSIERKRNLKKDDELGHKVYTLYVGTKPSPVATRKSKFHSMKDLRKLLREGNPRFSSELSEQLKKEGSTDLEKKIVIEKMAQEFTDIVKDFKLKVEKEGSRKFIIKIIF